MIVSGIDSSRTRARRTEPGSAEIVRTAIVRVSEPAHLCRVQAATRELCRSVGLDEGDVFTAVIAVSELAHRLFIEGARAGRVELELVRRRSALLLEARAENAPPGAPSRIELSFRGAAGTLCS
ncbi:MAG TPA: hypothetical protein VN915_03500 [Elusimicrobiota bacterium]|nr:hypothetical protein [Elusimicrobiota bacterium]